MILLRGFVLCLMVCGGFATSAASMTCEPTPERHALWLTQVGDTSPRDWFTRLLAADLPVMPQPIELYGEHSLELSLANGWLLSFVRGKHGWRFSLFDQARGEGGVDMTQVNPPLAGALPNSRDIYGWHFRNIDNSGSNEGSVNAPQYLRLFEFSTGLIGTAGLKPSGAPNTSFGRGWIEILDLGLADISPRDQARANYVKLRGCITWPRTEQEASDVRFANEPEYVDEEIEIIGSCGLDLRRYELEALVTPRHLALDIDGDDAADDLMQVVDRRTGQRDIALCRAGTWISTLSGIDDLPDYHHGLSALERWRVVPRDYAKAGEPGGLTIWPDADGDVLVLERIEKSMYLVYFADGELRMSQVYRFVEP